MHRTRGGLTGSRVAGQLGRILVLASLHKQLGELIKLCWDQGGVQLVAPTFVDNTFFLGASLWKATRMAELFGDVLAADWGQALTPTSRQVLATYGNPDQVPHNSSRKVLTSMMVLGHTVQSTGAVDHDYDNTVRTMWRSFFANAGNGRQSPFTDARELEAAPNSNASAFGCAHCSLALYASACPVGGPITEINASGMC